MQLRYWLLHCAVSAVLQQLPWLLWLPFSTHGQLVLAVWLQLPYFRAATLIAIRLSLSILSSFFLEMICSEI